MAAYSDDAAVAAVTTENIAFCFSCLLYPAVFVLCVPKYIDTVCFTDWESASGDTVRVRSEWMWIDNRPFFKTCLSNSLKRRDRQKKKKIGITISVNRKAYSV